MNDLVFLEGNQPLTTSLKVAEVFEMRHADVMRALKDIIHSAQNCVEFESQLFTPSEYDVVLNEEQGITRRAPMYVMTRDGFTLLAMGFTGEKALQFKLRYISAFNRMEQRLEAVESVKTEMRTKNLQRENELLKELVLTQKQLIELQREQRSRGRRSLSVSEPVKTQVVVVDEEDYVRRRFADFADSLFMNVSNFGHPVSIREVVISWLIFLGEPAIPQKLNYEIRNVKKWMERYCHANGIVINPEAVFGGQQDRERGTVRCTTYESVFYKGFLAMPRRRVKKSTPCWIFYREGNVPRQRPIPAPMLTGTEGLLPEMAVARE